LDDILNVTNQHNSLNQSLAGISDSTRGFAILFVTDPAFATYDLSTPVGPVPGSAFVSHGIAFPTSAGDLVLSSAESGTFQAVVQPVPEPGSLALLLIATATVAGRCCRAFYFARRVTA
jgi:hypothetical protein